MLVLEDRQLGETGAENANEEGQSTEIGTVVPSQIKING